MRAYLAGVSLENFARGNRRMLAAVKARRTQRAKQVKKAARKAAEKAQKSAKPGEKPDPPAAEPRRTTPVWERAAWAAGGVFLLWPTIGPAVPVTLGTFVAVWVVAALIAGQADADGTADTATEAPVPDGGTVPAETPGSGPAAPSVAELVRFGEALLRTVEYAVFAAHADGRPGVHLSTLAEVLRAAGVTTLPTEDLLADRLASLRVPVGPLTLGPKAARINRRGVRFDALSKVLGRTPRQDPATAATMASDRTPAESVA
jgi:hypothetical protein